MFRTTLAFYFIASLLSGCVTNQYAAGSAVSKPEIIIYNSSIKTIKGTIVRGCDEAQFFIEQQSDSSVICSKQATDMAQFMYGSSYGTPVKTYLQFNLFESGDGGIKITGRAWHEDQNAYGRIDKEYLDRGKAVQELQLMMNRLKEKVEGGKK